MGSGFILLATSKSTFTRLREEIAALGQSLKIGQSSEALPQAARKRFDFAPIVFFDSYKNIQESPLDLANRWQSLVFAHSKANFLNLFLHHKSSVTHEKIQQYFGYLQYLFLMLCKSKQRPKQVSDINKHKQICRGSYFCLKV